MLIEHEGRGPQVDPSAWIAPNAVLSGAVSVGARSRVLYGAVLTAEGGAELVVDAECVIMEQAVLRAAGRFPLHLGERSLVGPHAYLVGCTIGPRCFIATGVMIFNGASLGEACTVALGGKVHIDTVLDARSRVPIGYIAFGRPAHLYPPDQAPEMHTEMAKLDFMHYVFGIPKGTDRVAAMDEMLGKYTRALGRHEGDTILEV